MVTLFGINVGEIDSKYDDVVSSLSAARWEKAVGALSAVSPVVREIVSLASLSEIVQKITVTIDDEAETIPLLLLSLCVFGYYAVQYLVGPVSVHFDSLTDNIIKKTAPTVALPGFRAQFTKDDVAAILPDVSDQFCLPNDFSYDISLCPLLLCHLLSCGSAHLRARSFALVHLSVFPRSSSAAAADLYEELVWDLLSSGDPKSLTSQQVALLLEASAAVGCLGCRDDLADQCAEAAQKALGVTVELVGAVSADGKPILELAVTAEHGAPVGPAGDFPPLVGVNPAPEPHEVPDLVVAAVAADRSRFAHENPDANTNSQVRAQLHAYLRYLQGCRRTFAAALNSALLTARESSAAGETTQTQRGDAEAQDIACTQWVSVMAYRDHQWPNCSPVSATARLAGELFCFEAAFTPAPVMAREAGVQLIGAGYVQNAADAFALAQDYVRCAEALLLAQRTDDAAIVAGAAARSGDPLAICLEGEIRSDAQLLRRAWDASEHRLARAARGLAHRLDAQGDVAGAADLLRRAASLEPQRGQTWLALGNCLMKLAQADSEHARETLLEARSAFQRATETLTEDGDAFVSCGICSMQLGDYDSAISFYREALRSYRARVYVWSCLLVTLCVAQRWDAVARALHEAARSVAAPKTVSELLAANKKVVYAAIQAAADGVAPISPICCALDMAEPGSLDWLDDAHRLAESVQ